MALVGCRTGRESVCWRLEVGVLEIIFACGFSLSVRFACGRCGARRVLGLASREPKLRSGGASHPGRAADDETSTLSVSQAS